MRILGVGETCDLGALYLRLIGEGHDVRMLVTEPLARGTLDGLVPRETDLESALTWIGDAGGDGLVLFEAVANGLGARQDDLRAQGYNVVGGSAFGDRLEVDRTFAQDLLSEIGLQTAPVRAFTSRASARDYIAARPRRYVLKFRGDLPAGDTYVGQSSNGADVIALLDTYAEDADFILMDHVAGIEMGIGAYFNGHQFLRPACLDWEHKRFFAGDMGELTGEMGTVATFERSGRFFERTLARIEPLLRAHRHVGYVNLNTIVNAEGIWPLEFTCRFGYPGFAVLDPLQCTPWGDLLLNMATGRSAPLSAHPGYSVGIVVTTPPFPYSRKDVSAPVGLPIMLPPDWTEDEQCHLHLGEVGLANGRLVTSGLYGWTLVVTATGPTIAEARDQAYARAARIQVPNGRYRLDIGERLIAADVARLEALGFFDADDVENDTPLARN